MEINRNQWFLAGLVLVLFGLQFRLVDSIVLTPEFTGFLAEHTGHPMAAAGKAVQALVEAEAVIPPKRVRLPEWIGWALLSFGAVLVLHSLSLRRPG
jgi:hypothetical protein